MDNSDQIAGDQEGGLVVEFGMEMVPDRMSALGVPFGFLTQRLRAGLTSAAPPAAALRCGINRDSA